MIWLIFSTKTKTFDICEYHFNKPTTLEEDIGKFAGDRKVKSSGLLNHLDMRMKAGLHAEFLTKMYDYAKWVFSIEFVDSPDLFYVFTLPSVRR